MEIPEIDKQVTAEVKKETAGESYEAICLDCQGRGLIYVGTSGQDSDGNAPIFENCENCGGKGSYEVQPFS